MPETSQVIFSHKEVAEALIRYNDIHEGLWGLHVKFGLAGANVGSSPSVNDLNPAAIVPILKLGIRRFEEPNNLTADAAIVNPSKKRAPK